MRTKIKTLNRFAFAGKGTVSGDMALDLLEARELIKEMRSKLLIGGIQATSDMKMFRSIPVDSGIIADLIKRTKDYA